MNEELLKGVEDYLFSDRAPVSFREFVCSPDYCNNNDLYEFWFDKEEALPDKCSELILDGSLGTGKCIDINYKISTNHGNLSGSKLLELYKSKSDGFLEVTGLAVEQPDGSFKSVSHLYKESNADCVRIKQHFGHEIHATLDHPVLVLKKNEHKPRLVKCGLIEKGDYILNRKFLNFNLEISRQEAVMFFLYGYALGDGCYFDSADNCIEYNATREDIEWIRDNEQALKDNGECYSITPSKRSNDCCSFRIKTKKSLIGNLIIQGQDSHTKTLNESVFLSRSRAFATLMGLLSSDGGVSTSKVSEIQKRGSSKKPEIEYTTSSEELANSLCELFSYLSIVYSKSSKVKSYIKDGERHECSISYRFRFEHSFITRAYEMIVSFYEMIGLPNSRMRRFQDIKPLYGRESHLQNVKIDRGQVIKLRDLLFSYHCQTSQGSTINCRECNLSRKKSGRVNEYSCNARQSVNSTVRHQYSPYSYARYIRSYGVPYNNNRFDGTELNLSVFEDYVYSEVLSVEHDKCDVFDVSVPSTHIFMSNGMVNHNTWFSNYYVAYRLYVLFFFGTPQLKLGLAEDTEVFLLYFSVSMTMAKKSGFKNLYNIFKTNKWFKANYPINERVESSIQFPNKFQIDYASAEGHQIGLTVWGFILDEANFRNGVGEGLVQEYEDVTFLYQQLTDRLLSRFSEEDGSINALAVLISSASYQSSFVEKRKEVVQGDPNSAIITSVAYEVKPWKYSKNKFEVFIGTGTIDPCIIESDSHKELILRMLDLKGTLLEDDYFRKVPTNLLKPFKTNIALALQNHCGVPTQIKGRFLKNLKILTTCYDETIPDFFSQDEVSISNGDNVELIEYVNLDAIEHPERPHSFFFDLSVTGDTAGFSCYRYDGESDNVRYHTHVFTLGIVPPPPPHETRISKMRSFMNAISEHLNVAAFATDQFQSKTLRQDILDDLGLTDTRLSIDSSDIFHLHWVRGLVEKSIRQKKQPNLEREANEAEHDLKRRRVIKKKNSTDDLFQSAVGAYYLSDTVAPSIGTTDDLSELVKINVVGGRSALKMLNKLGYK